MKTANKGIVLALIICAIVYAGIGTHPTPRGPQAGAAFAQNTPQKVVPIISVGSGVRVGGALVTAPNQATLNKVVAVGQLEGTFSDVARIRALIPVSSTNVVQNLTRVPGASVIGLVDIKI